MKVERVPWANGVSLFTSGFEELAAYLAQVTDREPPAGDIVGDGGQHRRAGFGSTAGGARFGKLRRIGVDEFSYRTRHRYLMVVVDHDARRVVWAGEGRSAETMGAS